MTKKIIAAAIGASIIAAASFYLFSSTPNGKWWMDSKTQGAFSFSKEGSDPLETSAEFSGELLVKKFDQGFRFQWLKPRYRLSFGIAGAPIVSTPESALYQFLSEPWMMDSSQLLVSDRVGTLNADESLLALNLLRKISKPFFGEKDSAGKSVITMMDVSRGSIHRYEQAGGTYRKPWSVGDTHYHKKWSFSVPAEIKNAVRHDLTLNEGHQNRDLERVPKNFKKLLRLGGMHYPDFEKYLNSQKVGGEAYRLGVNQLVELGNEEAVTLLLNQLIKHEKNREISQMILMASLQLPQTSEAFVAEVIKLQQLHALDSNLPLVLCHFAGLLSEKNPNSALIAKVISPRLDGKSENLSCLGNSGLKEGENVIAGFLSSGDLEIKNQAVFSLRFIRTPTALKALLKALEDESTQSIAEDALKARVARGIYESELWKVILEEAKPDGKNIKFVEQIGQAFIMNYPGAFRDSKRAPQSKVFWK